MDFTTTIPADHLKEGTDADSMLNQPLLIPGTTGSVGIVRAVERTRKNGPVKINVEIGTDLEPVHPDPEPEADQDGGEE